MSWLSNLADKAEYLLVKLDHNASLVLQEEACGHSEVIQNDQNNSTALIDVHTKRCFKNELAERNMTYSIIPAEIDELQICSKENNEYEVDDSDIHEESGVLSNPYTNDEIKIKIGEHGPTVLDNSPLNLSKSLRYLPETEDLFNTPISMEMVKDEREMNVPTKLNLKTKSFPAAEDVEQTNENNDYFQEVFKLIKIRDDIQKQLFEVVEKCDALQSDLISTQKQCSFFEQEALTAKQQYIDERILRNSLEEELQLKLQEINSLNIEVRNNQAVLKCLTNELQAAVNKQVSNRKSSMDTSEMESKFNFLTKTLILKQNSLETLINERNTLRLQLERVESVQRRESWIETKKNVILNIDDIENSELFLNSGVTRRMKRTFSNLNTFSVRIGVFLRRYPITRLFIFFYMILLQIWVVIILFAYVPNSH